MTAVALHDVIGVRGQFLRSVQLTRDWRERRGLAGYVLTSTARDLASRMLEGARGPKGPRAWSITGPYGSGKSAFALFLTDLLARSPAAHPDARALRRDLGFRARPFLSVLVVGQRAPLVPTLLAALAESLKPVASALADLANRTARKPHLSDEDVVALFQQAADAAKKAGRAGLLIIIDEFGKFLEHAALHPEAENLFVMQRLAEAADRNPVPILLVTILHTAFSEYARMRDEAQRAEWQKVQGRFVDVAFQEPPEQLLRLVGTAIARRGPANLDAAYKQAIIQMLQSPSLAEAQQRLPASDLLLACAPIHPITALILWPLFRSKLAQNERSLFAFLSSTEPFGFQELLSVSVWDSEELPLYRIDRLYDYVTTALGTAAYRGDRARRWAEIQSALDRLPADAPPLAQSVVKTVGLLGLYGTPVGLRASEETVVIALGNVNAVTNALGYLEQRSLLVKRRHEGAYGLWEGSDVNLDACVEEARRHVGQGSLASRLKKAVALRPIVARAHYIRTGTLRYFTVDVIDGTNQALREALDREIALADGQLLYVLTPNKQDRETLIELGQELTRDGPKERHLRLLAFPTPMAGLEEALEELEAWTWVSENVPALQGDRAARQEVRARVLHSQDRLEAIAGRVFGLQGYPFDPVASEWVQGGKLEPPVSAREFMRWLSELCDEVYSQAPVLRNELLNRDELSSAAAKARRNLLAAMLTGEGKPRLEIPGTPAEVSMYEALLALGGFHRLRGSRWRFGEPKETWQPVWQVVREFLEGSRTGRRPVRDLFASLRRPPVGLRDGPLPVVLCAVLLAHRDRVALYENGLFVPELRIEVLERLVRTPDTFEIQEYSLSDYDREALKTLGSVIDALRLPRDDAATPHLLRIVKPLVLFAAHLPAYTKQTRRIKPQQAIAVREALLRARDPAGLLFTELPAAVGVPLDRPERIPQFTEALQDSLFGLQRAYPHLLDEIEGQLREVFHLRGTPGEAKAALRARAAPLEGLTVDRTLGLFVTEASRLNGRDWREVLARVINSGIPPIQWRDPDIVSFQVRLRQLASDFVRLEELAAEQRRTGAAQVLRIGLLNGQVKESREVIPLSQERAPFVTALADRIAAVLGEGVEEGEEGRRIRLAALAQAAARYLLPPREADDE